MTEIRIVYCEDPIEAGQIISHFLEISNFVPWGYTSTNKDMPCDYVLVGKLHSSDHIFYSVLSIVNIKDQSELSEEDFPTEWQNQDLKLFRRFYMINKIDETQIPFDDVRNMNDEELTQVGKSRAGVFVKYIGDNPNLEYLK